jgi:hypothetical protein
MLIASRFNGHTDAVVRCWVYRPMEHIHGFIGNCWILPSSECLCRIAPAAAMVSMAVKKINANKTQLLAS